MHFLLKIKKDIHGIKQKLHKMRSKQKDFKYALKVRNCSIVSIVRNGAEIMIADKNILFF